MWAVERGKEGKALRSIYSHLLWLEFGGLMNAGRALFRDSHRRFAILFRNQELGAEHGKQ